MANCKVYLHLKEGDKMTAIRGDAPDHQGEYFTLDIADLSIFGTREQMHEIARVIQRGVPEVEEVLADAAG